MNGLTPFQYNCLLRISGRVDRSKFSLSRGDILPVIQAHRHLLDSGYLVVRKNQWGDQQYFITAKGEAALEPKASPEC